MIRKGIQFFLFWLLASCINCENDCPAQEIIPQCICFKELGSSDQYVLQCSGISNEYSIEEFFKQIIKKSFAATDKLKLKFTNFRKRSSLSSNLFDGFHIVSLSFEKCNITKWADNGGEPAFVGLENTLEKLAIKESIIRPYSNDVEYGAAFQLGHLQRLREIDTDHNDLWILNNDWFKEGGKSVEVLEMNRGIIQNLKDTPLASLSSLRRLFLEHNEIWEIKRNMLPNPAPFLQEISLSYNELDFLPEDMFENMPSLDRIEMTRNALSKIEERIWKPVWSQLTIFVLEMNQVECDNHLDWLIKEKEPALFLPGKCYDPQRPKDTRKTIENFLEERKSIIKN